MGFPRTQKKMRRALPALNGALTAPLVWQGRPRLTRGVVKMTALFVQTNACRGNKFLEHKNCVITISWMCGVFIE